MQVSTTAQTLALAGLLQSTYLVDRIATTGQASSEEISPVLNSLFQFDADSPESVYGGVQALRPGLAIVRDVFSGGDAASYRSAVRYAISVLYLQGKISARPDLLDIIRSRLQHTELKQQHFTNNINQISSSIAAIYQDTVSTMKYRIEVNGSAQQLQNPANADTIRALLLAAIRSAVLWRQSGGKRWHFLFARGRLADCAADLLAP